MHLLPTAICLSIFKCATFFDINYCDPSEWSRRRSSLILDEAGRYHMSLSLLLRLKNRFQTFGKFLKFHSANLSWGIGAAVQFIVLPPHTIEN